MKKNKNTFVTSMTKVNFWTYLINLILKKFNI